MDITFNETLLLEPFNEDDALVLEEAEDENEKLIYYVCIERNYDTVISHSSDILETRDLEEAKEFFKETLKELREEEKYKIKKR